jgi:hypothetical protein
MTGTHGAENYRDSCDDKCERQESNLHPLRDWILSRRDGHWGYIAFVLKMDRKVFPGLKFEYANVGMLL